MTDIYNQVVEILVSLGVNSTFYFQFIIFFLAYIGMSKIVFEPYIAAHDERQRRTVGGQKEAESIHAKADATEAEYIKEARSLNEKIKTIYNDKNAVLANDKAKILEEARSVAEGKINEGRSDIDKAIDEARSSMSSHVKNLSQQIQNKFAGK